MKLFSNLPVAFQNVVQDGPARDTFRDVQRILERLRDKIVEVVNFNTVIYISQNSQPTPADGGMMVWKDADAASTFPTHYLLYNDNGTIVSWASDNVVP